jgi:hypothetical protein
VPKDESASQQRCNNSGGNSGAVQWDLVFQAASRLIFGFGAKCVFRQWNLAASSNLNWGKKGVG